ncbi:MAG: undecaprenyldiphospho-muramoylpentapeptide beta-N-acetylglucosaminyltransferase [Bacteroidales bacterium]|nr:undecaprenyldiphospho-muramoylpentapeptide beta-N-acetylglucosaminyltransferase [Bacteroidales bacterium]
MKKNLKIIVSGGGTGGHIFPAISIADAIKNKLPDAEILFVGAEGRMEMEKVPSAGYKIIGIPISGLSRTNLFKNFKVIAQLFKSLKLAKKIIKEFSPDVAVGVGGYASGPTLWSAASMGIPTVIQEQNSYAGVTNKLLAKKAKAICVAYEGMERFFPEENIIITGNPVRKNLTQNVSRDEAIEYFGLDKNKKTILAIGGSLGARTINQSIADSLKDIPEGVQIIWQSGKFYDNEASEAIKRVGKVPVKQSAFITRMDLAYAVADLVISRAGASSISELCLLGKPAILVPSPNVAEDHQTKNAMALAEKDAAILIPDSEAINSLMNQAFKLVEDDIRLKNMSNNIKTLAEEDSANRIADIVINIANNKK